MSLLTVYDWEFSRTLISNTVYVVMIVFDKPPVDTDVLYGGVFVINICNNKPDGITLALLASQRVFVELETPEGR